MDDIDWWKLSLNTKKADIPAVPAATTEVDGPVLTFEYRYKIGRKHRGKCILITNIEFEIKTWGRREGAERDEVNAEDAFTKLGFEVAKYSNLSASRMRSVLWAAAKDDDYNKDADAFALVISTHGGDGGELIGNDCNKVFVDEIVNMFKGDKCPKLSGKPKLFFFQACRGDKTDAGADVTDAVSLSDKGKQRIPVEADILQAFAVPPGFYAWRNQCNGSWFIHALARVVKQHGKDLDLMQMITLVNQVVSLEYESNAPANEKLHKKKQVPYIVSTLTKLLYFEAK